MINISEVTQGGREGIGGSHPLFSTVKNSTHAAAIANQLSFKILNKLGSRFMVLL
jgi:hypothetical protein